MFKKVKAVAIFFLLLICCSSVYTQGGKGGTKQIAITKRDFIEDPFGFKPTIENFSEKLHKRIKIKKYTFKNKKGYSKSDTIYKFYKGRSLLFIDKPYKLEQSFFSGVIKNKKITLNYGIQVGMRKDDFIKIFSDIDGIAGDEITFSGKNMFNNYTFVFKNNKLRCIKIDNKKFH